jgi:DNA-binding GntR family transcriptional regulator
MTTPESSAATETLHLGTVSTVDAAANVLRELILDGQLEPGARLREAEFAERLGIALEIEAVRLVIAADRVPEAAEESVRELSGLGEDAPWRAVVEPDMRFHRSIIDASASERLVRAYATVQSEVLLCLVWLRPHYDRPSQVAAEHEELIAVMRSGDADRAEDLFRAHLREAAENLTRAWQERTGEEVVV